MLKIIRVLFLGLVVLAGSACVTPTHASSAPPVVLTYIQASGEMGAKQELVVIYNNGSVGVDITGWCLKNKASTPFACFKDESEYPVTFMLPAYSYATIISEEYGLFTLFPGHIHSLVYVVTNLSSGSIITSSDTITLVDDEQSVVDYYTWTNAIPSAKALARAQQSTIPEIFVTGSTSAQWSAVPVRPAPLEGVVIDYGDLLPDPDPSPAPDDPEPKDDDAPMVVISEILANPSGADAGKEFIELYNPTNTPQSLKDVSVRIGVTAYKLYTLPEETVIPAYGYISFTDDQLGFTLVNTTGAVGLYYKDSAISELIQYISPKDDQSWALIDGGWEYSKYLTPGAQNRKTLKDSTTNAEANSVQKPCANNQFRNPETGRCKLIATASSTPVACKEGQERNPETNRCRSIVKAASSPSPCKEGQERNPETNRCRNIVKMTNAGNGIKGVQDKANTQINWYYWVAIALIVALLLGYAIWEWRVELLKLWRKLSSRAFAKHQD